MSFEFEEDEFEENEYEEDVSSGTVLKLPCFKDMNEHELTQYKLHDAVLKQDVTALRDLLSCAPGQVCYTDSYLCKLPVISVNCSHVTRIL